MQQLDFKKSKFWHW